MTLAEMDAAAAAAEATLSAPPRTGRTVAEASGMPPQKTAAQATVVTNNGVKPKAPAVPGSANTAMPATPTAPAAPTPQPTIPPPVRGEKTTLPPLPAEPTAQRYPALEELRKNLTDAERLILAEAMLLHGVPENHPILSVTLERIWNRRDNDMLREDIRKTAETIQKCGRVTQFLLSPSMSIGILFIGLACIAALSWTAGSLVTAAHLHIAPAYYPLFLAVGVLLGSACSVFFAKNTASPKPIKKAANTWN